MDRTNKKVYAVHIGRQPGVYDSWDECKKQVDRYPGARFRSFTQREEAEKFVLGVIMTEDRTPDPTIPVPQKRWPSSPPAPPAKRVKPTTVTRRKRTALPMHYDPELEASMNAWEAEHNKDPLDVYTDGSSLGNGTGSSTAGYGVYWADERYHHLNQACRLAGPVQTNNRAELTAILVALRMHPDPSVPLRIWTDSQYAINCIEKWMSTWRSHNWKRLNGEDVSNKDLLLQIDQAIGRLELRPTFEFVKGHDGTYGNEMADQLANEGARRPALPPATGA
ncbi:ribonuclease H [Malassezia equina]|uniref:Ribonuclease H n=1 Tax=Malassezia equina TaxID=1381935 RepID=A0AAF0ED03_9BASI|nr:ribonuclease H [Malassezia equina]